MRYTLHPYTGARGHFMNIDSDLNRLVNRLDLKHSWGEFIVGVENQFTMRRWRFVLQADWGNSFSKDSNSYMIQVVAYWRMSGLMSFKFGWTDWRLDVQRTVAGQIMTLDTHLSGPSAGLSFHF